MNYIKEKHPELVPLYDEIYNKKSRRYREEQAKAITQFCKQEQLEYVRNDDSMNRPFNEPPIVVNYFYHEEVRKNK